MNRIPDRSDLAPPTDPGASQTSADTGAAPSLPAIVAGSFERLNIRSRARMLGRLLASVGPLALAVVSGGAFAKYVSMARWPEIPVSFEDAARATSTQVYELVRYVEQSNPQLFSQLLNALARDTVTIAALGASIAAFGINRLASRDPARPKAKHPAVPPRAKRKPDPTA